MSIQDAHGHARFLLTQTIRPPMKSFSMLAVLAISLVFAPSTRTCLADGPPADRMQASASSVAMARKRIANAIVSIRRFALELCLANMSFWKL